MTARIDHLVITAGTLAAAVARGQAAMGYTLGPVGSHAAMATQNRLSSLGPADYLEAIAPDPAAPAPDWARWFGLDDHDARLVRLTVSHPQAGALGWALSLLTSDDRLVVKRGLPGLSALIHTQAGEVTLT
ncbi:MAG: hypothetical protein AUK37_07045 [Rhodobacterales bacterium CG2_30_65_12]|nr:MAG: hypothetical protein AUK37_07045 [Rhodobacterales bacterium CG2_30_65_12]